MEQRGRLRHRWANQPRWVAARERGRERVSNGPEHMSQSAGSDEFQSRNGISEVEGKAAR